MPLEEMAITAFYGMDEVRFVGPTKIGDTINVEIDVTEKKERDEKSGVISFKSTIKNQRGENLAIVTMKILLQKK